MKAMSRRQLLGAAVPFSLATLLGCRSREGPMTDISIEDVQFSFEDHQLRTPLKFGGTVVDHVTLLNVDSTVRGPDGRVSKGFGSMLLGNAWSFPSAQLPYDTTLGAMKVLAEKLARSTNGYKEAGHPIDLNRALEPHYFKNAEDTSKQLELAEPIPKLCTLVTASAFDAAIHDAYGKLHKLNCYHTYGPEFMGHDLSHYLGAEFKHEYLSDHLLPQPKPSMPLYHLVGAADPIVEGDIKQRIDDGLPQTLPEWIERDGLTHLKIKLNGEDLRWDVERVLQIDRVTTETQRKQDVTEWYYSCDFNEKCENVDYLLEFLRTIQERSPQGFERIQYIEQPTKRDLAADRSNVMHEAAKMRPVVIDESLIDEKSLILAREMGYTGAALKACKGQSQSLLMAAAAQKHKMFLCVQDLTCPGASLIHSAGIAAHVPGVAAIEANARQFIPAANEGWKEKFPGIFVIRDGRMKTGVLTKPGLSAVES